MRVPMLQVANAMPFLKELEIIVEVSQIRVFF